MAKKKSSRALIAGEPPMLYQRSIAQCLGVDEALAVQQLFYWLTNPEVGGEFEGRKWIYNTYQQWQRDNFPFWSVAGIKSIFTRLRAKGVVLVTDKLNDSPWNRTLWYTINYKRLNQLLAETYGEVGDEERDESGSHAA